MKIFNMIRGHFVQFGDKKFFTPAQRKEFFIDSKSTLDSDWQIVLNISTGNQAKVYISDILRVYTYLISCANHPALTQSEIEAFVDSNCLSKAITSYVIPLLATFADIKVTEEPQCTICFVPFKG